MDREPIGQPDACSTKNIQTPCIRAEAPRFALRSQVNRSPALPVAIGKMPAWNFHLETSVVF
jgi:hypothetical protein